MPVRRRLPGVWPAAVPTNARPEIFFVGSGDYHHLTPAFPADLKEPISLIHFDNHPAWVRLLLTPGQSSGYDQGEALIEGFTPDALLADARPVEC